MKKIQSLALALFATLSLASCSNEEPAGGQDTSNGETRYLSVNIVPTSADGSRAATDGGFENGTDKENAVTKVRFYFFTDGGDAAPVSYDAAAGKYKCYYDWTAPTTGSTETNGSNVEKKLNPVIVISTPKGDKLPGQIVAVINPDDTNLGDTDYNLENLRLKYEDYAALAAEDKFIMSNSVYGNGNEVIKSTKLTASNFHKSEGEATGDPVDIYVERCVAKVRASYNNTTLNFEKGLLPALTKEDKKPIIIHGEKEDIAVYVKIEGWNVTYTMPAANLSKHINLSWNNNTLGSGIEWNKPTLYRSYWATQNQIGKDATHVAISWDAAKAKSFGSFTYANENAERTSSNLQATNIIVAATLCDKDGKALTVCEYSGLKFADDNNFSSLKATLLTYLNNGNSSFYKKQTVDGGTKYVKIAPADITFIQDTKATSDKYNVYAQLTETAEGYEWVTASSDADEITEATQVTASNKDAVNTALKAQGLAKIYNTGMSYYYAPIEHYTLHGIVRNHIYNITVDGFYGLGTPVYDPEWAIILEKPKSDDAYLAARINILSWHLMNSNITFD